MQIVKQPDIFLRDPTSEVTLPLSPEDQVIIDQMNPVIEKRAKNKITEEEGCLSCPNQFADVRRPEYVGLSWICRHGKKQYKTFYHLPARVVQHEMDHLEGKLCIDYDKNS